MEKIYKAVQKEVGASFQYSNGYSSITIKVIDGEIIYAEKSSYRTDANHYLPPYNYTVEHRPNWSAVQEYLEDLHKYSPDDFVRIFKMLDKTSRSYPIARKILEEEAYSLKRQLENIEQLLQ